MFYTESLINIKYADKCQIKIMISSQLFNDRKFESLKRWLVKAFYH